MEAEREDLRDIPFVVDGVEAAGGSILTCSFCGARFTHGNLACPSCPLASGCDLVKCPRCGYGFPRTSSLLRWFERLARRVREMLA